MRLLVSLIASAAVVIGSPFVGEIRAAIRAAFPAAFTSLLGAGLAALVGLAVAAIVWRVRERRLLRIGLIAASLVVGAAYALAVRTGEGEVDAVERFHFLEYALIAWLFYRVWRSRGDLSALVLPACATVIVGVADEWVQWFLPSRVGELHDVWLNGAAAGCGLVASLGVAPPTRFSWRVAPGSLTRVGLASASLVCALSVFVQSVHLGHWIEDLEVGRFESRYTRERLIQLAGERVSSWQRAAPLPEALFAREDQYLGEALRHVRQRNRAWDTDVSAAWRENRILEKYYAPALDLRPVPSAPGFRWPPAQRADAAGRAGPAIGAVSDAMGLPVYKWSPLVFWMLALTLMGITAVSGVVADRRRRFSRTTDDIADTKG